MTVKRFDPDVIYQDCEAYPTMVEHRQGDYVEYNEYESLADRLADVEVELQALKRKIADVYLDM